MLVIWGVVVLEAVVVFGVAEVVDLGPLDVSHRLVEHLEGAFATRLRTRRTSHRKIAHFFL